MAPNNIQHSFVPFFLLVACLSWHLCITVIGDEFSSTTAVKPFWTTSLSNGQNVTLFEAVTTGTINGTNKTSFYFSPSAILWRPTANYEFNCLTKRWEASFVVELWTEDLRQELSIHTDIFDELLSVYPADSIGLAVSGPGFDKDNYFRLSSAPNLAFVPQTALFEISCKSKKACEGLVKHIWESNDEWKFELEFRNGSAARREVVPVSLWKHVTPTGTFGRILRREVDEVLMTETALDEFAEEIVDRVLDDIEKETNSSAQLAPPSPHDAIKAIRTALIDREVGTTSLPEVDKRVLLDSVSLRGHSDDDPIVRACSQPDEPKDESWTLGIGKVLDWLLSWPLSTETDVRVKDDAKWEKERTPTRLYAVNATKLASQKSLANITVEVYPPKAKIRFPVVVSNGAVV